MREVVLSFNGEECLVWPFGNNGKGYGVFHVKRRAVGVHAYVCEAVHGPKPTASHEAAHSCGRGSDLCCNPRHLRWATRSENHADKHLHGTAGLGRSNPSNKLSEADVRAIRALMGKHSQKAIARRFGVCQMTISHIKTGRSWGWLA